MTQLFIRLANIARADQHKTMRVEPPPRPSVATDNNEQVSNQHAKPKYTKKQRPTASTITKPVENRDQERQCDLWIQRRLK
jgi:hypothetical protein